MGWNEHWTERKKIEATRQYWQATDLDASTLVEQKALLVATVGHFTVGLWHILALDHTEADDWIEAPRGNWFFIDNQNRQRRAFRVRPVDDPGAHAWYHRWIPSLKRGVSTVQYSRDSV